MFVYKTSGVCSTEIHVDIKNDIIENVEFVRGCPGNLFGISDAAYCVMALGPCVLITCILSAYRGYMQGKDT